MRETIILWAVLYFREIKSGSPLLRLPEIRKQAREGCPFISNIHFRILTELLLEIIPVRRDVGLDQDIGEECIVHSANQAPVAAPRKNRSRLGRMMVRMSSAMAMYR